MKVLLLDVDGVLVHPSGLFSQDLARTYRVPVWSLNFFFRVVFPRCLVGKADLRRVLPPFLLWRFPNGVDDFLRAWFEYERHTDHDLVQHVAALRERGWQVYLATNQERYRVAYLLHDMKFEAFVDGEFSSATIGVRKPDAAYFERVTRTLGMNAHDVVFWDDRAENVEAARQAGWTAYHYRTVDALVKGMDGSDVTRRAVTPT
ncbi:HAD-IA family hydrolase [Deinococcus peraridilitoris]|uniref:Haloacid dehalogenase superfamily protein, subfamily IA, variant 3 with third motif having DD or ED n=1 Tax=Deinococcus peraridilitoris (strain DSM 19664 / LMG 22246 / CIP 109416 / KR-200) TaxID=937777 RepID=K9ZZK9_DEIPD|nr:HAD-IA family hydrolase [Deinococcus peraridilitoris]AFZ66609.1 haloacid dehalogenase superfamily protein, subfamily IA, variant 3 with third motif having DD or ED [Deinococcus peraridilitoris DSM 19664]